MKTKELEVDTIGEPKKLTSQEEKLISDFIKADKVKKEQIITHKSKSGSGKKAA